MLCKTILTLAACCPSWFDDLWMTDATPVPCGMSRETVKRSDLAGHAGYGYSASHSRWYWGLKLYLICAGDGMPIMWCLANPKIGERQVLAALLEHNHHLIRDGHILLADKGFSGKPFKQLTEQMGLNRKVGRYPALGRGAQPCWIHEKRDTRGDAQRGSREPCTRGARPLASRIVEPQRGNDLVTHSDQSGLIGVME